MPGWPRKKSRQQTNAENDALIASAESIANSAPQTVAV